jgi:hypothetical protein
MFTHIVSQISGRITALYTQVLASLKALRCKLVNSLLVNFTQVYQSAGSLCRQVVQTVLSIKAWLVSLITQALSTSRALISAKVKAIRLGLPRLITVLQIHQPAPTASSPKRGRPVGSTKSARSRSRKNKTAQTPMVLQSTPAGLKSQGRAKQRQQPAKQTSKKGK